MSNYLSITDDEKKQMLDAVKAKTLDDLFCDVPRDLWLRKLNIAPGISQQEALETMQSLAEKNETYKLILRGAGAYHHFCPPVVRHLASKQEFLTSYTPYQPEMSQGILQSIFEWQTMICELTGLDVSNASVYNGATAAAEGILMCEGDETKSAVIPDNINPQTMQVIKTYLERRKIDIIELTHKEGLVDYDALKELLNTKKDKIACVYFEQVNFFGLIEDSEEIVRLAKSNEIKVIMSVNPIAAALLKSAGECGADIAVGEGQSLGLPLNYGGPYLGFMACTQDMMRKLPGRIIGQTKDTKGKRVFVMTLAAREQHIRREKAQSNICTNSAHNALMASMYLTAMGPEGLKEVATACASLAHYAAENLVFKAGAALKHSIIQGGQVIKGEFFHEFVTVHKSKASSILKKLDKEGILGGLEIDRHEILWCFTEMCKKEDIDKVVEIVRKA